MNDADAPQPISGSAAFIAAAQRLITGARRELDILSYALDARIYRDEALGDAIRRLALSSEHARIRILLNRPREAVSIAPQLVDLARRATSRVMVRELADEDLGQAGDWLLVDRSALLLRRGPNELDAMETQGAGRCKQTADAFVQMWERAVPSSEMRELGL